MSAAPLLSALLRAALPGLRALDLGLPAPLLFPWLPGTLCGVSDTEALPPAEAALLRRFRHGDGQPLVGFDRAADAALLAGAPAAWGDAPELLIRSATVPLPDGLPEDALLLAPPGAPGPAGRSKARILLLLGAGETVERHDILVPARRLEAVHAALGRGAEDLAGEAGGPWSARALAINGETASVALMPEEAQTHRPPLSIPATALVHDLPTRATPDGLDLSGARQTRLLLGGAPPGRLRVFLRGEEASRAALFGDGQRLPATAVKAPPGEACLEVGTWPSGAGAAVLGVAVPPPARVVLTRLELLQ